MIAHRKIGSSGLRVSEISYGSWLSQTEGDALQNARAALDVGITSFDTADIYGSTRSEVVLGQALKDVRREQVVISTKVFSRIGPGANDRGLSRKHIIEGCNGSLRRLGCEYIDIYHAHRFDPDVGLPETLRAFDDLVRQGKVLYIGVSEWTPEQTKEALRVADSMGLDRIIVNQVQYNLLWRPIESELTPLCVSEGVGQIAWSPLAQGLLTGKYRPGQPAPSGSRAATPLGYKFPQGGLSDTVLKAIDELKKVAADCNMTLTQFALAWVLSQDTIASAIVGASRPEQLAESVKAAGKRLDTDTLAAVDAIVDALVERDSSRIPSQPTDYGQVEVSA